MQDFVKSRLSSIRNKDSIIVYFHLLKVLLDDLDLHPENPKLSLTVPKSRNDFVCNLNSRWVLNLNHDGSIAFMIGKRDFRELQKIVKAVKFFRYSSCKKPDDYFATYSYEQLIGDFFTAEAQRRRENAKNFLGGHFEEPLQTIVGCWLECCRAFEPVMRRSPYRKFHNTEFYELAAGMTRLGDYLR